MYIDCQYTECLWRRWLQSSLVQGIHTSRSHSEVAPSSPLKQFLNPNDPNSDLHSHAFEALPTEVEVGNCEDINILKLQLDTERLA